MEFVPTYPFYTKGTPELLKSRIDIAKFSVPRAAKRMRKTAENILEATTSDLDLKRMLDMHLTHTQLGDDRVVSKCAFSKDETLLATCSWTGLTKIWNVEDMMQKAVLKGHHEHVTSVAFSPTSARFLSTASRDRTAILWDVEGSLIKRLDGHLDSLTRVAFHPSGSYLGTTSIDKTWRLWDLQTGVELLLQEGHEDIVYGISFQGDGALVATSSGDACARVWDLRTGRCIWTLQGHAKAIRDLHFSPDCYHLATGSDDNTCRVWDLRKRESLYIIPAHKSLISQVKYEPSQGSILVTASCDGTCKIWSARDFKLISTLEGHDGSIKGMDLAKDGRLVATVASDRKVNLWSRKLTEAQSTTM